MNSCAAASTFPTKANVWQRQPGATSLLFWRQFLAYLQALVLDAGYNINLSDFEKISSSFCLFSLGFVAVPYVIDKTFELKFHD